MIRILPSKLLLLIGLNACLGLAYATQSMFDVYFVKNINNDTPFSTFHGLTNSSN